MNGTIVVADALPRLAAARRVAGYVAEGDVAVDAPLAGHPEHALTDDVAGHLGRATTDLCDLPHHEVDASVARGSVVVGPGRPDAARDLVRNGEHARAGDAGEQPGDRGRLVSHAA